jgi:hypothetical protein
LRKALDAFRQAPTASNQEKVYRTLLMSTLVFPVAESEPIRIAFLKNDAGETLAPAFTDKEALLEWLPTGSPIASAAASAFIPAVLEGPFDGLVLNPGSRGNVVVDRSALQYLRTIHQAS